MHVSIGKRGPENNAKFTLGFKGVPVIEKELVEISLDVSHKT